MADERKSRVVLITGATDGLGKAAGVLLAQRGYKVFAAGRSHRKLAELDQLARDKGLALESLEMNVCDDDSVPQAVGLVLDKAGSIDVLVNNAGIAYVGAAEELSLEDWRRQFETNVFGVVRVTQAVLPHMRERRHGRILMMSSVAGLISVPAQGAYCSSKHAVEGLSNALRYELYPFGIDVILIEPGYIVTGIQQAALELTRSYTEKFKSSPYSQLYARFFASAKDSRARSKTTPEDCARVMLEAIEAAHPKARYGVTPSATAIRWCKRLLTDAALDRMVRKRFGIMRETRS
jgi:NAD(P)-dependent dehydrogenase (short-subunit alcohol dehydrogenase family)